MNQKARVALIILDGWGIGPNWGGNAIVAAKTPNMDYWWRVFPHTALLAAGEAVGLPAGTCGNSETGHLNIGAGRIVPQDLPLINMQIENGSFFKNEQILSAIEHVKKNNSHLHLMGLVGFGHVHSDLTHLFALIKMAKDHSVPQVYLDLFTDGRDSDPNSALSVIEKINQEIKRIGIGKISSICGRYFAMDRDKNWGRTARAYNALSKGEANVSGSYQDLIAKSYVRSISDEFIEPCLISDDQNQKITINDNDAVIFFNFRPDRARQISQAFVSGPMKDLPDKRVYKNLYFVTFVTREPNPFGLAAFTPEPIICPIAEVVSQAGLKQFHIAETEKYAHVTYFINGGREKPFAGEAEVMIPSPKVVSYNRTPSMSAPLLTKKILTVVNQKFDLIIANYANADMVGHAGNFYSTVQAVEAVDALLGPLVKELTREDYVVIITADHGNAEEMLSSRTNSPQTEHSSNPVPFIIVTKNLELSRKKLSAGGPLANIAPTILEIMGIEKPKEMTATSLFEVKNGK